MLYSTKLCNTYRYRSKHCFNSFSSYAYCTTCTSSLQCIGARLCATDNSKELSNTVLLLGLHLALTQSGYRRGISCSPELFAATRCVTWKSMSSSWLSLGFFWSLEMFSPTRPFSRRIRSSPGRSERIRINFPDPDTNK